MQNGDKGANLKASIIIPCKNEGANVRMTVDSILAVMPDDGYEIIIVDDSSSDDCCLFLHERAPDKKINIISSPGLGAARARNLGAQEARGEYLVFCDAHITVPEGWPENLLKAFLDPEVGAVSPAIASMDHPDRVGCGQTWNPSLETLWLPPSKIRNLTAVPLLPGGCLAVRAGVFRQVGGFDRGFIVWGYEDVELSLKLWLFGFKLYVNPSIIIEHRFRKKHPYPVKADHVHYNLLRMAYSHFNNKRIDKVIDLLETNPKLKKIIRSVIQEGAMKQRVDYFSRRKYDDDWFMSRFNIKF
ncbi:MAG: Poly-beta-1,6-N-acetyl-D-glucosamine synthase [Pelotomaculum sp. PtaB.Bin104]|nr:MAG: Poly-beta-1,6-N-acetyl-D-glucosamine synthase [Pelotomaculum sp. PtaB.Bin104]